MILNIFYYYLLVVFFRELNNIHNIKGYKYNYKKGKGIWWRNLMKNLNYIKIYLREKILIFVRPHESVVLDKQNYMTVVNYFKNHKKISRRII